MRRNLNFPLLLFIILGVPLVAMILVPFADTSEPRYAEMARVMATSGDWITPWFSPGVPFWGKPPFSFWMQALSMKVLGVSEFTARFPSWLATVAAMWLIFKCALEFYGAAIARRATLIYATCALVFMTSGAVLTDPFLALGAELCMVGWLMASRKSSWFWRYSFFFGLIIGLLAKGPLIFVLCGGVLVPWLLFYPASRKTIKALPWISGSVMTLVLVLPWYIAAELKTPGFLDYFIIGEHFRRFLVPGWQGDRYGYAHKVPHGTIWLHWLQAAFPWSLVTLALLGKALVSSFGRSKLGNAIKDTETAYFLGWTLFTPVFFTLAGNILWTYMLPALGGFSILLARAVSGNRPDEPRRLDFLVFFAPIVVSILVVVVAINPDLMKTEKTLVNYFNTHAPADTQLYYLNELTFSARFYSEETAKPITEQQIRQKLDQGETLWVGVPKEQANDALFEQNGKRMMENLRFVLYQLHR
jgi:4-amino-4-deoxy-L-arabinose transferase-like glycosyltransferase